MDNNVLKRAAEKIGTNRVKYIDNNVPTSISDIYFIPYFGDYRYTFILSSFILKQYKQNKHKKYFVLCSWPGYQNFFPYIDEFWNISDSNNLKSLSLGVKEYDNESEIFNLILRRSNEWFENVVSYRNDLIKLYKDGFTKDFWESYKNPTIFYPSIQSETIIPESVRFQFSQRQGKKIFINPTTFMRSWQKIYNVNLQVPYEFWIFLCESLIKNGYVPVVCQNYLSYDLSKHLYDQCIFYQSDDFSNFLPLMRMSDCVLDIHSGISRLAISARVPFLCVDERSRYFYQKDSEIDMLCVEKDMSKYIFSYSSMITTGDKSNWGINIVDCIMNKLSDFLSKTTKLDGNETEKMLDYSKVILHKNKKCGISFIRSKFV